VFEGQREITDCPQAALWREQRRRRVAFALSRSGWGQGLRCRAQSARRVAGRRPTARYGRDSVDRARMSRHGPIV